MGHLGVIFQLFQLFLQELCTFSGFDTLHNDDYHLVIAFINLIMFLFKRWPKVHIAPELGGPNICV